MAGGCTEMLTTSTRAEVCFLHHAHQIEHVLQSLLTELRDEIQLCGGRTQQSMPQYSERGLTGKVDAAGTAAGVGSHAEARAERPMYLFHKLHLLFLLFIFKAALCSCQATWRLWVRICSLLGCLLEAPLWILVCSFRAFLSCLIGSCHLHVTCISLLEEPCPLSGLQADVWGSACAAGQCQLLLLSDHWPSIMLICRDAVSGSSQKSGAKLALSDADLAEQASPAALQAADSSID